MDLTSGTPFWPITDGLPTSFPRLRQGRRCDVAVIGGGITGAFVAHRFALAGIHTVLLEGVSGAKIGVSSGKRRGPISTRGLRRTGG